MIFSDSAKHKKVIPHNTGSETKPAFCNSFIVKMISKEYGNYLIPN